jgi:hypothetical protein
MRAIETLMAEGRAKPKRRRRRRDRFAPVLSALLQDLADRPALMPGDPGILRLAREDLRHLRAVVAAAYQQAEDHSVAMPCSCPVCRAVWDHLVMPARARCRHVYVKDGVDGLLELEVCKLCGALPYSRGGR